MGECADGVRVGWWGRREGDDDDWSGAGVVVWLGGGWGVGVWVCG